MDVTWVALVLALTGIALLVCGTVVIFGPWAMVVNGGVLLLVGLVPDWERAS